MIKAKEATAPLNGRVVSPAEPLRVYVASLRGRAVLTVAVLLLTLIVLPGWFVIVGYEINLLNVRPQTPTEGNLRGESVEATTGVPTAKTPTPTPTSSLHHKPTEDEIARLLKLGDQVPTDQQDSAEYPEVVFGVDWSTQVSRYDILHLGALQRACTSYPESAISWQYGQVNSTEPWTEALLNRTMDEEKLLEALKQCPPLDIYIPTGLRGQGYCEDAAAYTKFLQARMIPHWVLEIELFDKHANRKVTYHELCPRTPMLFFNHYWDGVRDDAKWPNSKPLYLMPNIEMYELEAKHYWEADVILCKTAVCTQYINKWYEQVGNPRMTEVIYHRFTTSDMATNALVAAGGESAHDGWSERERPKDFENAVFVHTAGGSTQKGSKQVLDCWLARPDLPNLKFYIAEGNYNNYVGTYDKRIKASPNIELHVGGVDAIPFGQMIAKTAFFLCTSVMEGYGHYINHARASGGLIITPDVPPMNELVTPSSGVMLKAAHGTFNEHFLGGTSPQELSLRGVEGYVAKFGGGKVCAAVDEVLKNVSVEERRRRAHRVRQQCFYDTAFFAMKMRRLRKLVGFQAQR